MQKKALFDYNKKCETPSFGLKDDHIKSKSKEREIKNMSYIGVSNRRYPSHLRDDLKQSNKLQYSSLKGDSKKSNRNTNKEIDKEFEIETYNYSNSNVTNQGILNVIAPNQGIGFHITDLIDKPKRQDRIIKTTDNSKLLEKVQDQMNSSDLKPVTADPLSRLRHNEEQYMIKNFRIVNLAKKTEKETKPITAAPLSNTESRARVIK